MSGLLAILANFVTATISSLGLFGILGLSLLESTGVPVPSEVILPFGGFLASTGRFNFWWVVAMGTIGNLLGSLIAYEIARRGGRPLVEKYGRAILLSKHDLDRADRWFKRQGALTVFIGRLLPIIRTYISFPAGLAEMPLGQFIGWTTLGAFIWSWLLAYLGFQAGSNWEYLRARFHGFDTVILVILVAGMAWWIYRHIKEGRQA